MHSSPVIPGVQYCKVMMRFLKESQKNKKGNNVYIALSSCYNRAEICIKAIFQRIFINITFLNCFRRINKAFEAFFNFQFTCRINLAVQ